MEKGLRNTLIISGVVGGATVGGYLLYKSILKAIDFDIEPRSIKVLSRDAQSITLGITMIIINPSDLTVTVSKQQYDVYLNDVRIAVLTSEAEQVMYKNANSELFLELKINYLETWNKIQFVTGQTIEDKLNFIANFKDQKLKMISKLDIKYGILPSIPIDVDSGAYTLKEWGFVG